MRVIGLDVGERRIGVAVSDSLGLTAQRLPVMLRHNQPDDLAAIAKLAASYAAERIIIGLPLNLEGRPGPQAQKVKAFGQALAAQIACPVDYLDERLTTRQGQQALLSMDVSRKRRKDVIDAVAAQLILQQYLDMQRHA